MKTDVPHARHRFRAVHIFFGLFFILIAFFLRLASQGLPQAWVDAALTHWSPKNITLEMENVAISWLHGELRVGRIRCFKNHSIQPAWLELKDTQIALHPRFGSHPLTWIQSIHVGSLHGPTSPMSKSNKSKRARYFNLEELESYPPLSNIPISCAHLHVLNVELNQFAGYFSLDPSAHTLSLQDFHLTFPSSPRLPQKLEGSSTFNYAASHLACQAQGHLDPTQLIAPFHFLDRPRIASILSRFTFPDTPPAVSLEVDYRPSEAFRNIQINLKSGYCTYRNTPFLTLAMPIRVFGTDSWNAITVKPLTAQRPEGSLQCALAYQLNESLLAFEASSTFDPLHLARIVHLTDSTLELPFAFDNPTHITAKGYYDFLDSPTNRTDIRGEFQTPCILSRGIAFEQAHAQFHFDSSACSLTNLTAHVLGGNLHSSLRITPKTDSFRDATLQAEGDLSHLRFSEWGPKIAHLTPSETDTGSLSISFTLQTPLPPPNNDVLSALQAKGQLEMKSVHLYTIPLFAGLTGFLAKNIPGVDFLLTQDDLKTNWSYAPESLKLDDLQIAGNVFSASAYGTISRKGLIDIRLKGHLLNRSTWLGQGLYYALFPLSKILEFQATGPLKSPTWAPANIPGSGLFSKKPTKRSKE